MTVRFKNQTEYQKSYGVSRSRSASPQRCAPLASLHANQMGVSREPGLQQRRRPDPVGPARSCSSLLCPPGDVQRRSPAEAASQRRAPSAVSRSRSAHRREPSPDPKPPPGANAGSPAEPRTPEGPRPSPEPEPPERPRPAEEPAADGKSVKPRPSQPDSQPQPGHALTAVPDGEPPSAGEVDRVLWRKAGLRSGQRSGGQRSEYRRQFGWKKPTPAASPILTAEQALCSGSRSVPPFKKNPISMETEYQRSFQGLAPAVGPRLRKHLEHQRVPLFHTYKTNRRRREELQDVPPREEAPPLKATPPPPHPRGQKGYGMLTEYQSSFRSPLRRIPEGGGATDSGVQQVKELRQKALLYRHRAWGTNFSRDHLSQLVSEHNALWEPTDTTVSGTDSASPGPPPDPSPEPDDHSTSCVEPLDLASNSSKTPSVVGSGETRHTNKNTQTKEQADPGPPAERRTAWEEEQEAKEEEESTDDDEGRLPTPRLKMRPVQRTHHDLTTPATGGAILVGKLRSAGGASPHKQQRCGSAVSVAAGTEAADTIPAKPKEASSENIPAPSNPTPDHKPASSLPSKPIRMKQTPPSPAAPPPLISPPVHGFQGTMRHPDFQHNGDLGLRLRELQCSGGGCGSDEDDRLSVMSWRSAASCSMASAVLERAQKRREDFWGKR